MDDQCSVCGGGSGSQSRRIEALEWQLRLRDKKIAALEQQLAKISSARFEYSAGVHSYKPLAVASRAQQPAAEMVTHWRAEATAETALREVLGNIQLLCSEQITRMLDVVRDAWESVEWSFAARLGFVQSLFEKSPSQQAAALLRAAEELAAARIEMAQIIDTIRTREHLKAQLLELSRTGSMQSNDRLVGHHWNAADGSAEVAAAVGDDPDLKWLWMLDAGIQQNFDAGIQSDADEQSVIINWRVFGANFAGTGPTKAAGNYTPQPVTDWPGESAASILSEKIRWNSAAHRDRAIARRSMLLRLLQQFTDSLKRSCIEWESYYGRTCFYRGVSVMQLIDSDTAIEHERLGAQARRRASAAFR